MSGRNVVVVGATGMVGGLVLEMALARDEVARVTTVGRRATGIRHPKLQEVIHEDFSDCSAVEERLAGHDAGLFCLGAYTGTVPDSEFRRITVDYAVGFAQSLAAASPRATLCLLSGQGADQTGRSRLSFARYKGEAEKALLDMGFPRVLIFRPGYIYPATPRREPNLSYRVLRAVWPWVRLIYPNGGVASTDLARAMLNAALRGAPGYDSPILENRDIREFSS